METNQFAELASAVVRQLPRSLDSVTAQRWIREQGALAETLRKALAPAYELYLAPAQRGGTIKGFDLDKHLQDEKLTPRTMGLEDEVVKGWLADPSTYPEEFKGKAIFLWKSQRGSRGDRSVACLIWRDGRVVVLWDWLDDQWHEGNPVLLASS
jgi:hypothetical protein